MRVSSSGFSLLETLAVIAIAGVLIGLSVRASLFPRDYLATDSAARQFQTMAREARALAIKHRTPTRIVFVPRSLSTTPVEEGNAGDGDPYVECLLFRFVIPEAAQREAAWRLPGAENAVRGGDALERMPIAPPGLPAELVGQWKRAPVRALRFAKLFGREIEVRSPAIEDFASMSPEEYAIAHAYRPPAFWVEGAMDPWIGRCQSSPFPENYHQTPLPDGPELVDRALPATARIFDPQANDWRPASDYWPASVSHSHFALGAGDEIRWHDLPFIEFDANGRLQSRWSGEREVIFAIAGRPGPATRVVFGLPDSPIHTAAVMP
jgi:prepilin-type N-terminal cleavage/methylation domain-containing protein